MDDDKTGAYVQWPSGSFSSWENTMCNPLGSMRTQTQNAWHDGYASAKVEHEWIGLTDDEIKECFVITPDLYLPFHIYQKIETKLKEKNT